MHAYYCDDFRLPLPDGHRFPMEKYSMLRMRVAEELPDVVLNVPPAASNEELMRAHTPDYVSSVTEGLLSSLQVRRIGFPWSPQLVERSRRSAGATLAAARSALEHGGSTNLAGGTHHAYADRGEGFCVFNDVAVSALALAHEGKIERAAVLDLDVHQGNGTASIFESNPAFFTASVHGEANFPFRKEPSDLDLPLPDGTGDRGYLAATDEAIERCLGHEPDVLFYVSGADPFDDDRLGRLAVSKAGLRERDERVAEAAASAGVPVVLVMAGGYARSVADTVDIHFGSVEAFAAVFPTPRVPVTSNPPTP